MTVQTDRTFKTSGKALLQHWRPLRATHALMKTTAISMLAVLSLSSNASTSNSSEPNWQAFALAIVEQHYIPSYTHFAEVSAEFDTSAKRFCSNNTPEQLTALKSSYINVLAAWQRVQHIDFGPITYDKRRPSFQYWPDKKGYVAKRLAELKAISDPNELDAELNNDFAQSRFSIGGFNALERLLFQEQDGSRISERECKIIIRHTENFERMTSSLAMEWQEHMLSQFQDPSQLDGFFEDEIDAATFILKTLVEPIEGLRDHKLLFPMGSAFGKQKYKRLESWRSQRSAQNVAENLHVIKAVQAQLSKVIPAEPMEIIQKHLNNSLKLIEEIGNFEEAINVESGYQKMQALVLELSALHAEFEKAVTSQGIHLGFNSRDGD